MSQSQKMRATLKKLVIPSLLDRGFVGEYPHYKKIYDDRIELLSFETNKWGNSFTVEVSTLFLPSSKRDNNFSDSKNKDYDNATVWDTNYRYRLRGMFDGWFYYTDVYEENIFSKPTYNAVSETKAKTYAHQCYEKLVQKADDEVYAKVCAEVNKQMENAYKWWELFYKNKRLKIKLMELIDEKRRNKKFKHLF